MLCAIATDDGIHLMMRHFGDARQYEVYRLDEREIFYQETILNSFREEDDDEAETAHEAQIKASNMKELFLEKGISVLVSKVFGPNIKRMVKNFVPVIVRYNDVEKAKDLLIANVSLIQKMLEAGEERQYIILK